MHKLVSCFLSFPDLFQETSHCLDVFDSSRLMREECWKTNYTGWFTIILVNWKGLKNTESDKTKKRKPVFGLDHERPLHQSHWCISSTPLSEQGRKPKHNYCYFAPIADASLSNSKSQKENYKPFGGFKSSRLLYVLWLIWFQASFHHVFMNHPALTLTS